MTVKVYLVAGEASGDLLGARLMRALKSRTNGKVSFYGVGGETMQAEGLNSLFDIKDLSVMDKDSAEGIKAFPARPDSQIVTALHVFFAIHDYPLSHNANKNSNLLFRFRSSRALGASAV